MHLQPTETDAYEAAGADLIRTRHTLAVCVVCGHECIHIRRQQTSCPICGSTALRSFSLYRDLREKR